jgi:hypothetical protein
MDEFEAERAVVAAHGERTGSPDGRSAKATRPDLMKGPQMALEI